MSITGQFTRTDDDCYAGFIGSLTFDVDVTLAPNEYKSQDKHPDFAIWSKTPRGRSIRIGGAWEQISKAGNRYLSVSIDVNGQAMRGNAVKRDTAEGEPETFELLS